MHPILLALIAAPILLHDTDVLFDSNLVANTQSTAFVSVRGASSLTESQPLAGAQVILRIDQKELARAVTDEGGRAPLRFQVPALEPGSYALAIDTESPHGRDTIERSVRVVRRLLLSLRTDRTVYRPGETIRFGVALLNRPDAHPLAASKIAVSVKEPGGTEIWRGQIDAGDTGFGAGKVTLGDDLRLGRYLLEATALSETARAVVSVREVELPAFFVSVDASGLVTARYPYGEPVRGKIEIIGGARSSTHELDAFGRFQIGKRSAQRATRAEMGGRASPDRDPMIVAKRGDARVEVRVTDGAGRSESSSWDPPAAPHEVSIAIVPERGELALGRKQFVTVVTTDGSGRLAPAEVALEGRGVEVHGAQSQTSRGAVRFMITPHERGNLKALATAGGKTAAHELRLDIARSGPWIRPLRTIGERGEVEVFGRFADARGPVVLTLVRGQIPLATETAEPDAQGYFTAKLRAPDGVFGLATVRAAELSWSPRSVEALDRRANASVYLVPAPLEVAIEGGVRFRPGETAELTAQVKDASGRPAANVGLFASVVDERSLALGAKQKDLAQVLRSLDMDDAPLLGLAFTDLLGQSGTEAQLAARAIVESLPPEDLAPSIEIDAVVRMLSERERMPAVRQAAIDVLVRSRAPIGKRSTPEGPWSFARSLADVLRDAAWESAQLETPWRLPITWSYARQLDRSFAFAMVSAEVANLRMDELASALTGHRALAARSGLLGLVGSGKLGAHLALDPWGGGIALSMDAGGTVRSAGADGRFDTGDDLVRSGVFRSHAYGGLGSRGVGAGGGGYGAALGGISTLGGVSRAAPAAIRSRFDETVLWAAGLRTDAQGRAILRVPFSDSVTGWQLDVDALGANGAVGHGAKRLETFIPLSVDADVPSRLTTGDRYSVSAVAANHTEGALTLAISMEASGAIELEPGSVARTVALPAGTTGAVRFAIRAVKAGVGTVLLALAKEDGQIVDRVKREIRIEGPGRMVQVVLTGQVAGGEERMHFEVPSDGEEFEGRLRLFRSPLDQAIDGLENLLSEPNGCFEQTSSATYPNLMVLRLLPDTKESAAMREKAYDLVSKGYQRLIAYEVGGGGFSWFGEAPANQALTSYGLLEFNDMSKVYPVDPALIDRTRRWLLSKQQSNGAWAPDASWLHDWSAVQGELAITAYVTWALVESEYRGPEIDRALAFLAKHEAELTKRPYLLALWAAASRAPSLLAKLRAHQRKEEGGLAFGAGAETLFYVKGAGADVQVTALAVPLLKEQRSFTDAADAMKWIWSARQPQYGWGSPQGTVLALRAAQAMAGNASAGEVAVDLDGKKLGAIDLDGHQLPALSLPVIAGGAHTIDLSGSEVLADLRLKWRQEDASTAVERGLAVTLSLPAEVELGANARARLAIANRTGADVPMPTVIVPVPPGFVPSKRSLAALKSAHRIDRFETTGTSVLLYLSKLGKSDAITLDFDLTATAECEVTVRSAQAYAYYDPATRGESANMRTRVLRDQPSTAIK